jgi:sarcosine/dimethylglycine N-methyltransferase
MRGPTDERALVDQALLGARLAAFAPGEFVGQESFMRAGEILSLAERAGVGRGVTVLDLCCGVAGPGRLIAARTGCDYLGVDSSPGAVGIARERAAGLACRFEVAHIPPVPAGAFDVVLLLETMLAFRDKDELLRQVASALRVGGRFAFTMEEGEPLTEAERAVMPEADTVWLVPLSEMRSCLERAGLRVHWQQECSQSHRAVVDALVTAFSADASAIEARLGRGALDQLVAAHRLWGSWLREGRARKFAFVAEKTGAGS